VLTVLSSTAVERVLARLRTLVLAATTSLLARDGRCWTVEGRASGLVVLELWWSKSIDVFMSVERYLWSVVSPLRSN
jgi:hypothetical protein